MRGDRKRSESEPCLFIHRGHRILVILYVDDLLLASRDQSRIDSFKERLTEHFGTEEDGGLFQGIQEALPQAESDVRRLRAQHARLDEALEKARAIARRGDPAEAPVLKAELDRFLALMREHERDEDALLKRALRQDEC